MSDSYIDRIKREGPLPGINDDSELVGDDDKPAAEKPAGDTTEGAKKEHRSDFMTLPAAGAGAFPVPMASESAFDDENEPADAKAEPDADQGARQDAER